MSATEYKFYTLHCDHDGSMKRFLTDNREWVLGVLGTRSTKEGESDG